MTSPSHTIRPDDYSEAHDLQVDIVGVHKQLRNLQDNIYGYIMEPLQNAFDSNDEGVRNTIEMRIGHKEGEPGFVISDRGESGITKDYDGDIDKFIDSMKATTEKLKRGLNRKGIGMFQYTNIASNVIITSMDQEMIYRIPMWVTPSGTTAYGKIQRKPRNQKYEHEFGIFNPGTIVAFHNRDPKAESIIEKELIKNIREKYALRLYENRKSITTIVDGKEVIPPVWIEDHPPKLIQRMTGGHNIRGNLWFDEKGNGRIKIFQNGYMVEVIQFEPRQCSGYLEINVLETNAGRTGFVKDNELWNEFKRRIERQLIQFPRIQQEAQDEKYVRKVLDLAQKVLILNKVPTAVGGVKEVTKVETFGDRHGSEVVGYPVSPEPDPDRFIIHREGTDTRNLENQTRVGNLGLEQVKKTGREKGKRKEYRALDFQENQHLGSDRPLFCLYQDRKPWLLIENADNAEHAIYEHTKDQPKLHNCKLLDWLADVNAEIAGIVDERIRMEQGRQRVLAWKVTGFYPTVTVLAKGLKRRV
jgi:hypothetical protein